MGQALLFIVPADVGTLETRRAPARLCQNQDLQDWRDLQDFAFAQPAPFAITETPANPNTSKRLPLEDTPEES